MSKSEPLITVIVPVNKIGLQIDLIHQWLQVTEYKRFIFRIVIDQFDDPESMKTYRRMAEWKFQHVTLSIGVFGNPGEARNSALGDISTEWFAFWDSDDIPDSSNFGKMLEEAEQTDADVCIGNFQIMNFITGEKSTSNFDNSALDKIKLNPGIWRFAFRTSKFSSLRFPKSRMGEDQVYLLNVMLNSTQIYRSKLSVYTYVRNQPTQLTSRLEPKSDLSISLYAIRQLNLNRLQSPIIKAIFLGLVSRLQLSYAKYCLQQRRSLEFVKGIAFWLFFLTRERLFWLLIPSRGNPSSCTPESDAEIVYLAGGLGNQLFQFSAALNSRSKAIVLESGLFGVRDSEGITGLSELELPGNVIFSNKKYSTLVRKIANKILGLSSRRFTNLAGLFCRKIVASVLLKSIKILSKNGIANPFIPNGTGFDPFVERSQNHTSRIGYFQSYSWFARAELINELRQLSIRNPSEEFQNLRARGLKESPVIVHIRGGDYLENWHLGALDKEYFIRGIRRLRDQTPLSTFWIFTNDYEYVNSFLDSEFPELNYEIISNKFTAAECFMLMRDGSAYLISNSTFSWWAAYLRNDHSAPVFYPDPWFRSESTPIGLIPPDWLSQVAIFRDK